jgi:hypothetical protein
MRKPHDVPKPSLHCSRQAVCRLYGTDHYLGRYGNAEAQANYDTLIRTWLNKGRCLPLKEAENAINDIILAYIQFAETHYKPGTGTTTGELRCIIDALRVVKSQYGRTPGSEFGPKKLKALQKAMLGKGWYRSHANHQIARVKRMFKWAVETHAGCGARGGRVQRGRSRMNYQDPRTRPLFGGRQCGTH